MKISVAGTGYVGLSMATLLAQKHQVTAVDIVPERVEKINAKQPTIQDDCIEEFFATKQLNLRATTDPQKGYSGADFVIIAAPTNYDPQRNFFDTSAVESVIQQVLKYNPDSFMVIKSTIPVGFTEYAREKYGAQNLLFSPEFLRESKALYDNLYPSRIIVGTKKDDPKLLAAAQQFAALLQEGALKEDVPTLFMGFTEAEAVKLFANTYLALDHDLELVPVVNKIDLPAANLPLCYEQMEEILAIPREEALSVSGKTDSVIEKLDVIEKEHGISCNHEPVIMSPVSGCHNGPWLAGYGLLFLRREDEPLE